MSTLLRADAHLPAGTWRAEGAADEILIDFDARFRRRFRLRTQGGRDILLDLPQAIRLRDGDGLNMEDGSILLIRARPEPLLEITAHNAPALMRIAWHLGNRHLPVQFAAGKIHIRADHVIADMIAGLGGHTRAIDAPFDPEAGAYAAGGHHHHDDDHDH